MDKDYDKGYCQFMVRVYGQGLWLGLWSGVMVRGYGQGLWSGL